MKFEKGHDLTDAREQIGAAVRELELKHDKEEGEIGLRLMAEQTEKRRLYKEREAQKAEDAKAGEAPAAES